MQGKDNSGAERFTTDVLVNFGKVEASPKGYLSLNMGVSTDEGG